MIIALLLQVSMPQDWDQCVKQPDQPACVMECMLDDFGEWCDPALSLDEALRIDERARELMRERPDRIDTWSSYADRVEANKRFTGDCDDLVSTVLDLWARAGAPAHQIGRMIVKNPRPELGGDPEHMVATIEIDGAVWIAGDTYGPAQTLEGANYFPLWTNKVSNGISWTKVEPA